jgi:hypothetical protein
VDDWGLVGVGEAEKCCRNDEFDRCQHFLEPVRAVRERVLAIPPR